METGEPFPFEYRFIRPDNGLTIYLKVESILVEEHEDRKRVIGAVQDVTEERQISNDLQEVQNSLLRAQSIANVGSWEWSVGDENVWWSNQMYKIYERDRGGPITVEEVRSYIHPDDQARIEKLTKNDLGPNIVRSIAYRILLQTGGVKHVVSVAEQVKDAEGKIIKLVGTLQDQTERARIEDKLRTLSLVASETINGVLIHNPDGKVVWANDGFTRITGYSAEEIIGHEPWEIVADEHTNMKLVEMTYEKISKGKPFSSDNLLRHKNGTTVWVHTTFTPIKDDSGNISRVISIGTDITKQKELEELQRITLKRLQKRNKELSEKRGS